MGGYKNLKFEDDTYLNIVRFRNNNEEKYKRTITGTVFRDRTSLSSARIKTGNGILDEGEYGVYGAKVELFDSGNNKVAETTTGKDGKFILRGFIPGEYYIKYSYGHNKETVLLGQSDDKTINRYSYNGEDYQATNNYKTVDGMEVNILDTSNKLWHIYNEAKGISTAKDDEVRRKEVMDNVLSYKVGEMKTLNNLRDYVIENYNEGTGIGTPVAKWNPEKTALNETLGIDDPTTIEGVNKIINDTNMYAKTEIFLIPIEKPELIEGEIRAKTIFGEYNITNMNFGLAEAPQTTIDLKKYISGFTVTDAMGKNVIAMATNADGDWTFENMKGDILYSPAAEGTEYDSKINVQIEDEKLQGARLEVTYTITKNADVEIGFDGETSGASGKITGLVDLIDNNLSYNPNLGENSKYWDIIEYNTFKNNIETLISAYPASVRDAATISIPTADKHNTILQLKSSTSFLTLSSGTATVPITLEKVLSATHTLDELLTNVVDISTYNNTVRITGWEYVSLTGGLIKGIDRIRTPEGNIILPGIQYDTAEAEVLVITPPTGDNSINIMYYIIAIISLGVLAAGVFGIKKFVIKK